MTMAQKPRWITTTWAKGGESRVAYHARRWPGAKAGDPVLLTIGKGGWTMHIEPHPPVPLKGGGTSQSIETVSHYGDTWRENADLSRLSDDVPVVDCRGIPELVSWALCGPVFDVKLSPGTMRGPCEPGASTMDPETCGALHQVSRDVYLAIADCAGCFVGSVADHIERVRS